jgi:hypothetical protein
LAAPQTIKEAMMDAPQSWSDLSPEQSEAMNAIISDYRAGTIGADAAIAQVATMLNIPVDQAPDAIKAMIQAWMTENRELLDWAGSLAG